jgi:hypothetical protein
VLLTFYAPSEEEGEIEAQYWRGFRLLAHFSGRSFKIANRHKPGEYITGKRPSSLAVVSYDLFNHLSIDAHLQACCSDKTMGALPIIHDLAPNDLIITDRGFVSYEYMATCFQQQRQFLTRTPKSMYADWR